MDQEQRLREGFDYGAQESSFSPWDLLSLDGVPDGQLRGELGHLGGDLARLQGQLVGGGEA